MLLEWFQELWEKSLNKFLKKSNVKKYIDFFFCSSDFTFIKKYGNEFKLKIELDESSAKKYIKGEQIEGDSNLRGYGVFLYKGFVLGGFKTTNGRANNLYPKNLRV